MNIRLAPITLITLIAVCIAALPSFGATDDEIAAKLKTRDIHAVDKLARERLAKDPQDEAAYNFVAIAALSGDQPMRDAAIPIVEACIEKRPKAAICHHRIGQLYGTTAMSGGMMAVLKYAPKIKDHFLRAVELDPANFDARRDLIQYYLQAPGIAGGSAAKARENAEAHAKVNALQGALLGVDIHLYNKEFDQAEKVLAGLPPPADDGARNTYRNYQAGLGFALINASQFPRAQKVFEKLIAAHADYAQGHFGLGRALLESGQVDAAIAALEKTVQLDPTMGAQYRLGIAYQTKGEKTKALANLQQFVDTKPPRTGKAADDARQRIEALKKAA